MKYSALAGAMALGLLAASDASAVAVAPSLEPAQSIIPVAGGCGPGGWRGPWGHCRNTPYYGPLPGGYYQPPVGNGCPPGYWRGPWGHCRNTPYHGRLPGGGWQ
ncbi:GCG_CRPN prefix-to-repeats domain-containing protein [Hansschlegelia plantiphila]|uniref:Uncharacterized protein n=1 Tax=Hansschlegelia plantiphila TaxID=374655 RepID=A0A9W6IY24_9HYPH|nr:hypothetical protein GCM10008179_07800 [Hansschlegelia plantiphila]